MNTPIIEIKGISKKYRIGAYREPYLSLRDNIMRKSKHIWNMLRRKEHTRNTLSDFWALKEVFCNINQGECVGIIGSNGAGKSTLLKILSQITPPTEGSIIMRGRVASLLEVGTGFHPELTGRENIFLNGAILGMTRGEIRRKFDEIVAFAEIEQFLDTPVKRYSSGMYVRLAFAVAAHLEPEILVVDEVLAVGDVRFQKKCLGKMTDVTKHGRTILFVSHNMEAIQALCSRSILLDHGTLVMDDKSSDVVARYLERDSTVQLEKAWEITDSKAIAEDVQMQRVVLTPINSEDSHVITVCTAFNLEIEYWNFTENAILHLSVHIINERGIEVINALPAEDLIWQDRPLPIGLFKSVIHFPGNLLNNGSYHIDIHVVKNRNNPILKLENVINFQIEDSFEHRGKFVGKWYGVVRPRLKWTTEYVSEDELHNNLQNIRQ